MIRSIAAGAFGLGVLVNAAVPAYADATGDVRAAMVKFLSLSSYEMSFGTGSFVNMETLGRKVSGATATDLGPKSVDGEAPI